MKRIISLLLPVILLFSITACSQNNNAISSDFSDSISDHTESTTPEPTSEVEPSATPEATPEATAAPTEMPSSEDASEEDDLGYTGTVTDFVHTFLAKVTETYDGEEHFTCSETEEKNSFSLLYDGESVGYTLELRNADQSEAGPNDIPGYMHLHSTGGYLSSQTYGLNLFSALIMTCNPGLSYINAVKFFAAFLDGINSITDDVQVKRASGESSPYYYRLTHNSVSDELDFEISRTPFSDKDSSD